MKENKRHKRLIPFYKRLITRGQVSWQRIACAAAYRATAVELHIRGILRLKIN